ncbi:hypothetical protein [Streptomyces glaucescens]|uniref:Uncharacterized protein n=1 Tax=Streptomyces glaucescens TaxID=1907 RepID=A0A089XGR8_STRGA|nr:hypothetical protein [Streptomyces glaucescens]AIS02479.1 hypothetical protein SGLAU_32735 [Streptomyces glaucescens]
MNSKTARRSSSIELSVSPAPSPASRNWSANSEGLAYYCGFSHSAVGLLTDAEERLQRIDAKGILVVSEAVAGAEREAQYEALDRRAREYVKALLAEGL